MRPSSKSSWGVGEEEVLDEFVKVLRREDGNPRDFLSRHSDKLEELYDLQEEIEEIEKEEAEEGGVVEDGDIPTYTFLHYAAKEGRQDVVEDLLERNVGLISVRNDGGYLPIHYAARHGHRGIVGLFIERDPECAEAQDNEGEYPIHHAAIGGHAEIVRLLATRNEEAKDYTDDTGATPAHNAAIAGSVPTLETLRDLGADLCTTTQKGYTPLQYAQHRGKRETVRWFSDQG